jgi:hypothetical protein
MFHLCTGRYRTEREMKTVLKVFSERSYRPDLYRSIEDSAVGSFNIK